jgi:hypothetical protein
MQPNMFNKERKNFHKNKAQYGTEYSSGGISTLQDTLQ